MIMRFRGGGVGHTSTRAVTNIFRADRDGLDIKSRHKEEDTVEFIAEDLEDDFNDLEGDLSESKLFDYGYEVDYKSGEEEDSEEEREDGEGGEEDDMTLDELDVLGYADY